MNLEEIVRPSLQQIRDKTDNSVSLAVLSEQDVLFLVYISTKQLTRVIAGVGTRFPAYATAAGRAILAFSDKEAVENYLDDMKLEALTERTVKTKREIRNILTQVRKNGYASTDGQLDFGLVSVAVPVFNEEDQVIASVSCATASARYSEADMIENVLPDMKAAAREI